MPALLAAFICLVGLIVLIAAVQSLRRDQQSKALGHANERFELAAAATRDAMYDWHIAGNRVWRNPIYQELFGPVGEFALGGKEGWWANAIHPEDRGEVLQSLQSALTTDGAADHWQASYRLRRVDGDYAFVVDRGYILRDERGNATRMIGAVTDLTSLRRAERNLRETMMQLDHVLRLSPAIVQRCGPPPECRITYVSSNIVDRLGYTPEAIYRDPLFWTKHIHPADRDRFLVSLQEIASWPGRYDMEYRIRHADGHYIWFLDQATLARDEYGEVSGVVVNCFDISARKRVETVLSAVTNAQLAFIANSQPKDVFGQLLDALLSLTDSEYGYIGEIHTTPDERLGLKTHAMLDIAWNEQMRRKVNNHAPNIEFGDGDTLLEPVIRTGRPIVSDGIGGETAAVGLPPGHPPLQTLLGLPLHVRNRLIGIVAIANRAAGYSRFDIEFLTPFLVTCAHILDASNMARQRDLTARSLRESETRLRQIAETADEVFALADVASNRLIYVSPAFERLWGRSNHEVLDNPDVWVDGIHPDDRAQVASARQCRDWGRDHQEMDYRVQRPDGSTCWVRERSHAVDDVNHAAQRVVTVVQDVTFHKNADAELRRLHDERSRVDRLHVMGEMASALAHEIRQPLCAISAFAKASARIRTRDPGDPKLEQALTAIAEQAQRADQVIDQVRRFVTRGELHRRPVRLSDVISRAVLLSRPWVDRLDIRIDSHISESFPCVNVDATQLEHVLLNLLQNALEAVEGKSQRWVRFDATQRNENTAEVSVTDSGGGIGREIANRVFEPYFTTKPNGTGMGLAIAHSVIEAHGGKLWCDTGKERGMTFSFTLPIAKDANHDAV